jgi:hypothetical protein
VPAASDRLPRTTFSRVDLPDPFAPSSATNSPGAIAIETSLQIGRPATRTLARSSSMAGALELADPLVLTA